MKRKLIIEIETSEKIGILPEEGTSEEDYSKEDLVKFRAEYDRNLSNELVNHIKEYFKGYFEEEFLDRKEEGSVEGFNSFEDYKIKVKCTEFQKEF
jgi:hypothetical protein